MKGLLSIIIFLLVVSQVLSEFQRQTWRFSGSGGGGRHRGHGGHRGGVNSVNRKCVVTSMARVNHNFQFPHCTAHSATQENFAGVWITTGLTKAQKYPRKYEAVHEVPFPLLFMGFNKREVLFHHSAEPTPGGQRWVWCRVKPSLAIAV